jgi:excisionase family DNA binding protein
METTDKDLQRRWLDVKAAAAYLGATVSFVRALLWDGEVPLVRAGKRFIVDRQDLDAWMTRRKERNAA